MSYRDDHASAYTDVLDAGASVTFSAVSPGTYDAATDTFSSGSTSTTAGAAMRVNGDAKQYEALALVANDPVTLLFVPTTYAAMPSLGATVSWNSITYTVRSVQPIAPDGNAIVARVIVSR